MPYIIAPDLIFLELCRFLIVVLLVLLFRAKLTENHRWFFLKERSLVHRSDPLHNLSLKQSGLLGAQHQLQSSNTRTKQHRSLILVQTSLQQQNHFTKVLPTNKKLQ